MKHGSYVMFDPLIKSNVDIKLAMQLVCCFQVHKQRKRSTPGETSTSALVRHLNTPIPQRPGRTEISIEVEHVRSNAPELKALSLKQSCFRDSPLEYVPRKRKLRSGAARTSPRDDVVSADSLETHHLSGQEPLRDGVLAPGARKTRCLASESKLG